ncbi:MAG: Fur family transcriptional regulator [Acidimicrobiales bacterium]
MPQPAPTKTTRPLGNRHGRTTRQGGAVLRAVQASPGFRSAQEIHAELRAGGEDVGLTTVYRHLQLLVESGELDALQASSGETVYRHCATSSHHHHLVCRECGTGVEVDAPAVEQWAMSVAREASFTDITHTVEIFGLCSSCSG